MKQPKPTRKTVLEEFLKQVEEQLAGENDWKLKKVLVEKQNLIRQMLDELPHRIWPEPALPPYRSGYRYYQTLLGSPSYTVGDMTHTDDPHPYIRTVTFQVENSEADEWHELGSEMRQILQIEHNLGIEWFVKGKYDIERHERYDSGHSTLMKATVDSFLNQIVDLQWADPWKKIQWRKVVIPAEVLARYNNFVRWRTWSENLNLAEYGITANSLLFFRKVNYPDGRVMHIRLESGNDECWLLGFLLDRTGKELVSDYFRCFPAVFTLQYGDTLYEAMIREDKTGADK